MVEINEMVSAAGLAALFSGLEAVKGGRFFFCLP
jgi:hypothetical protein